MLFAVVQKVVKIPLRQRTMSAGAAGQYSGVLFVEVALGLRVLMISAVLSRLSFKEEGGWGIERGRQESEGVQELCKMLESLGG